MWFFCTCCFAVGVEHVIDSYIPFQWINGRKAKESDEKWQVIVFGLPIIAINKHFSCILFFIGFVAAFFFSLFICISLQICCLIRYFFFFLSKLQASEETTEQPCSDTSVNPLLFFLLIRQYRYYCCLSQRNAHRINENVWYFSTPFQFIWLTVFCVFYFRFNVAALHFNMKSVKFFIIKFKMRNINFDSIESIKFCTWAKLNAVEYLRETRVLMQVAHRAAKPQTTIL